MFQTRESGLWLIARFGAWLRRTPTEDAVDLDSRALIVHPDFVHTLYIPAVYSRGLKTRWGELPWELLLNILLHLDSPRDLAVFQLVNSTCRYERSVYVRTVFVSWAVTSLWVRFTNTDRFVAHRLLASDQALWRRLCLRDFSIPRHAQPEDWKELYR